MKKIISFLLSFILFISCSMVIIVSPNNISANGLPTSTILYSDDFSSIHYNYTGWQVNTENDDTPWPLCGNMTGDVGAYPLNDYIYTAGYGMYIKWDLSNIPNNVTITSASVAVYFNGQVGLYQGGYAFDGINLNILACNSSWNASTMTFNNGLPSVIGTEIGVPPYWNSSIRNQYEAIENFDVVHNSPNWTDEMDITPTIEDWYSGALDNNGIHFKTWAGLNQQGNVEYYFLNISNVTNFCPRLTIHWTYNPAMDSGIEFTSTPTLNAYNNTYYSYQSITNRSTDVIYNFSSTCPWLSINPNTGLLYGTPNSIGQYNVYLMANWSGGQGNSYAYQNFTLTIHLSIPHSTYGDIMLILFILGILMFAVAYAIRKVKEKGV